MTATRTRLGADHCGDRGFQRLPEAARQGNTARSIEVCRGEGLESPGRARRVSPAAALLNACGGACTALLVRVPRFRPADNLSACRQEGIPASRGQERPAGLGGDTPAPRRVVTGALVAVILGSLLLGGCTRSFSELIRDCTDTCWESTSPSEPEAGCTSRGFEVSSFYLVMRDGTRIAVDLYLPAGRNPARNLPALMRMTPYGRSYALQPPFSWVGRGRPFVPKLSRQETEYFLKHGYAWLEVDVRGTGASFGTRPYPFAPEEVRDGAEIVDWIVSQPWSNGRVGALGSSYSGLAANFLTVNRHPAVRAVAPRFCAFDLYPDLGMPGGVPLAWFTETWGRLSEAMEDNRPEDFFGWEVKLYLKGVRSVDDDPGGRLLREAVRGHRENFDIREHARRLICRDDVMADRPEVSIDTFSPHAYARETAASGAAVYSYSGWFDGACANSAIKRHLAARGPGNRLTLGPWAHGGWRNQSPFGENGRSCFDHYGELLRFFDSHLKDRPRPTSTAPSVHYFTMGEEKWKQATAWPPPGGRRLTLYCAAGHLLSRERPTQAEGEDIYPVNLLAGTGEAGRWKILMGLKPFVLYPERETADRALLCYTSSPLERDLEVTGHPVANLWVRATAPDLNLFAYLEDVGPAGQVVYVSEGQLRALHRAVGDNPVSRALGVPFHSFRREQALPLVPGEVSAMPIELQPTSYLFRRGHSLRLAIAGADKDYFTPLASGAPQLALSRKAGAASCLDLPVMSPP